MFAAFLEFGEKEKKMLCGVGWHIEHGVAYYIRLLTIRSSLCCSNKGRHQHALDFGEL